MECNNVRHRDKLIMPQITKSIQFLHTGMHYKECPRQILFFSFKSRSFLSLLIKYILDPTWLSWGEKNKPIFCDVNSIKYKT